MTNKTTLFSVTKSGMPLDKSLYTWDEKTRTFSSDVPGLVLDFSNVDKCTFNTDWNCTFRTGSHCTFNTDWNCTFRTGSHCTFNTDWNCTFNTGSGCTFRTGSDCTFNTDSGCTFRTGSHCTFNTGSGCTFRTGLHCTFRTDSDCTFNTGSHCTFNTGSDCTFNTGSDCTFRTYHNCVIIRRDAFEIITPEEGEIVKLCPFRTPGYISKKPGEDAFYMQCGSERTEHIIADGILSKVISKKQIKDFVVYKVVNHNEKEISFVVYDGENYSHGSTVKEAKEDLKFKISNRDTSKYKNLTLSDKLTIPEAVKMYRTITGACERGTKYFVQNTELKKRKYSIQEIVELTKGQYNHNKLEEFFRQTCPAV